jgi:NAD-dependent deacetylase
LLSRLSDAQAIVAFTGAGISAESGVPTFRGNQGLWNTFKPEELANLDAFMRNPALVWEWYAARKKIIAEVQPNAGHYALAELEDLVPTVSVITQNIDNLHRRAGSSRVFELHGNIERNYCMKCGNAYTNEEVLLQSSMPSCSACDGLIRPDVVWFGESLPVEEWNGAVSAAESSDVLLSVGTSGVVYPAAELPLRARRRGVYVIEVNIESTNLSDKMDEAITGRATDVLPELCAAMRFARRR